LRIRRCALIDSDISAVRICVQVESTPPAKKSTLLVIATTHPVWKRGSDTDRTRFLPRE